MASEMNLKKKSKKKLEQVPWIMVGACDGCGDCVAACSRKGLQLVNLDRKVPNAWLVGYEECTGCGRCGIACISGALQMTGCVDWALERYAKTKGGPYPSRFKDTEQKGEDT